MEEREQDQDDKTEEATEERRRQFREEGNIASPRELLAALALTTLTLLLIFVGKNLVHDMSQMFTRTFSLFASSTRNDTQIFEHVKFVVTPLVPWLSIGGLVLTLAPVLTGLVVTRFHWSWKKLELNFEKLNPVAGVTKIFGTGALGEGAKSTLKMIVIGAIVYVFISGELPRMETQLWSETPAFSRNFSDATIRMFIAAAIASVVYGIGDYGFNLYRMERQMMMSKRDLKEEVKSQEGDPHVKGARRRMARDLVLRKNLSQVQSATFIVTNPEHFAVALRYVKGMSAPVIVAKGQDFLALKIRELAKKHDIIIVENKPLARTLYKTVKIGQEIPSALYASVIEVMKFIYRSRGKDYFDRFGVQPFQSSQTANPQTAGAAVG